MHKIDVISLPQFDQKSASSNPVQKMFAKFWKYGVGGWLKSCSECLKSYSLVLNFKVREFTTSSLLLFFIGPATVSFNFFEEGYKQMFFAELRQARFYLLQQATGAAA